MGWKVFPLHTVVDGRCSCGKNCGRNAAKHPRTRRGFKDGTTDPEQIKRWWRQWPGSNVGIATGDGLVVVDVDGPEGASELKALVEAHGALPDTLCAQTGGGIHIVFTERPGAPATRSSARDHVHFRGAGGYIVAAPSKHHSGRTYQWVKKHHIAELPEWLRKFAAGYEITKEITSSPLLGSIPSYLQKQQPNQRNILESSITTEWSSAEQARLTSALAAIPANSHDSWVQVGMALKDLDWQTNEGDIGFDLWVAWSETCPEKFALGVCEQRWKSFKREGVTLSTVYHLAKQHGWTGGVPEPGPKLNGANGHHALPAAFASPTPIFFPDMTEEGKVRATMLNAKVAIQALGLDCRYDLFHNRMLVAGELINKWNSSELSDHVTTMIRDVIRYRFGFDPNKANVQDACEALCLAHRFDPVLDYLDSLIWDGVPRLDRWMATYLGAVDNELNRAIGRLSLLAAVRRAFEPGTKFDQIIVLEGPQGQGKSEALEILAGAENFSDQSILGVDDRKQQELTEGVWLYEIGELSGLRRAEIEHVKAFASRKSDRARPAYGRYMVSQPRRTVFFASTNKDDYLQDETGNRRFWPVALGRIDHPGLRRDRDQLWAEAAHREAAGESHMLPESLWDIAAVEQERRTVGDEWIAPIGNYLALKGPREFSLIDVLCDNQYLRMDAKDVGQTQQARAARVLRGLGYERFRGAADASGHRPWRYRAKRVQA